MSSTTNQEEQKKIVNAIETAMDKQTKDLKQLKTHVETGAKEKKVVEDLIHQMITRAEYIWQNLRALGRDAISP